MSVFKVAIIRFSLFVFLLPIVVIATAKDKSSSLFISPVEINAGRMVVEDNCAKCHGLSGESKAGDYPHLASQHADYLFTQLKSFQLGERVATEKLHYFRSLSEDALKQAAIYYSMQDLSIKAMPESSGAENKLRPFDAGKAAAAACSGCHGETGNGTFAGMPHLTSLPQAYLASAIAAYKSGDRDNAMMKMAAESLTLSDIDNIALYYAMQTPEGKTLAVDGDVNAGRELAAGCSGCHGEAGRSLSAEVPSLAGQDPVYLIKAINDYKAGSRNHAVMRSVVEPLSEAKIVNIVAYYAEQKPKAPVVIQPLTAVQIAEKCDRCHGINGNSIDRFIPSISAQNENYLASTLKAFKNGSRTNRIMQAMLEPLREVDIDALAKHYGQQRRRAVVFVDQKCD